MKSEEKKKAIPPSRVFLKIGILPIPFPIRAAAVSESIKISRLAMEIDFGKRRIVKIEEKRK